MAEKSNSTSLKSLMARVRKNFANDALPEEVESPSRPAGIPLNLGSAKEVTAPLAGNPEKRVGTTPSIVRESASPVNRVAVPPTIEVPKIAMAVLPGSAVSDQVAKVAAVQPKEIAALRNVNAAESCQRLGEMLVERCLITREQLATALAKQASSGQLLGRILLDLEFLTEAQLTHEIKRQSGGSQTIGAILERLGMPAHHIRATIQRMELFHEPLTDIMRDWRFLTQENVAKVMAIENNLDFFPWTEIDEIPIENLRAHKITVPEYRGYVPIAFAKGSPRDEISIVISDAGEMSHATNEFKNCQCHFQFGSPATTQTIFRRFFARTELAFDILHDQYKEAVKKSEDLSRMTIYQDLFMTMLRHACYTGASDVALHKSHKIGMVRLKVDGVWEIFRMLASDLFDQLYGVMRNTMIEGVNDEVLNAGFTDCALDLKSDRREETKRLRETYSDIVDRYVYRVEVGNSVQGKTVTIRINDTQATAAELNQLGFDTKTLARLVSYIHSKTGVVLITGPTGSGKTTTLYSLMNSLDALTVSLQTVEQPVEYTHGLWQQFPLNRLDKDEGKQWGNALRGLLRNAPDVILYGETRDENTAKELFRAANTGQLVLSTLHTNGAAETTERLEDLGIPKPKMATVLLGVLAQRLVRKLCAVCKIVDGRPETMTLLTPFSNKSLKDLPSLKPYRAREGGCVNCGHSGYRGRRMVYELFHCSKDIKGRLEKNASLTELRERGTATGTMLENGLRLVAEGITSIDELATHIDLEI